MVQGLFKSMNSSDKYIFNCSLSAFLVNGFLPLILGVILPMLSLEYNLSTTICGLLLSSHSIGNLFSSFAAGLAALYLGKKNSIIILNMCGFLGLTLIVLTSNPIFLIFAFALTGIGRGSVSNINNTVVNEVTNSSVLALNLMSSSFAAGAFLAPFLVMFSEKTKHLGWRFAVFVVIVLGFITIYAYSKAQITNSTIKISNSQSQSYKFLKQPHFLISAGILFFYMCTESAVTGWIVTYFIKSNVMSKSYAQTLAGLLWLVILIGRLVCGAISSKITKKVILLATTIGVSAFFILLISTANIVVITISIIGLGFFMSGIYATTVANVGDIIKAYPMAMSVLLTIAGIGAIAMPSIVGFVAEFAGIAGGMSLITVAVILMFACAIINAVRKQRI